jgi:hypothetical protein
MNNKSYGLYEISDLYKKKFLRRFFNIQKQGEDYVYGALYKGHMKGDVPAYLYRDFPGKTLEQLYESIVPATGETNPNAEILNVIDWINKLPENASKADIEKQFDIDMFLKYALIEYLSCHWDGYLGHGNNYFIYIEPSNGKYHFFSYDFDMTLGKWCKAINGTIDDYVTEVNPPDERTYGGEPQRKPLLYSKIINNPEIKPMFESLGKEVVSNLFNIEALGPRIDYFYEFLKDDLYWDVGCYNIIETKLFADHPQELPTIEGIDAQYTDLNKTSHIKSYIKARSENFAKAYNMNISFKSEGKYGTVGNKLVISDDDENETVTQLGAVSSAVINNPTILLFTLMILLFTYLL